MGLLLEFIVEVLWNNGPTKFEDIKTEIMTKKGLKVSDEELSKALEELKASHEIESVEANSFCWSIV